MVNLPVTYEIAAKRRPGVGVGAWFLILFTNTISYVTLRFSYVQSFLCYKKVIKLTHEGYKGFDEISSSC
jgi:hypothetical protein